MTKHARTVSVISDLHLGGEPSFRMMTNVDALARFIASLASRDASTDKQELVINGDFVDFLAESHGDGSEDSPRWVPFIKDPARAAECFETMASRDDGKVFDALGSLLEAGHRLTILPGNHDVELCLPSVREALLRRIGARSEHDLFYQRDGEAYVIGNAVIEHGNRYDESNFIDHEQLHRLRVQQSLRQSSLDDQPFAPPFGSHFVAEVMNGIKERHPFVDLLKPEGPALVALLLAIDPSLREALSALGSMWLGHRRRKQEAAEVMTGPARYRSGMPRASTRGAEADANDALGELLTEIVGEDALTDVTTEQSHPPPGLEGAQVRGAATRGMRDLWKVMKSGGSEVIRLLIGGGRIKEVKRLDLLRQAVRKMGASPAFERDAEEEGSPYLEAARELARSEDHREGFDYIVFGHSHHSKDIPLGHGARYLNSGTWANLMCFPAALFDPSTGEDEARRVLDQFVGHLANDELEPYIRFEPTYVRMEVGEDGNVREASVEVFEG